jgi:hypothetical protein
MTSRDEDAGIADDQPARLEDDLDSRGRPVLAHDLGIGVRQRRRIVVLLVGNAEPAAEIDMLDACGRRRAASAPVRAAAEGVVEGCRSVIWLPICMSTPVTFMPGQRCAARHRPRGRASAECRTCSPSLPVEIFLWVLASTSGLMRSETGAVLPAPRRGLRQQLQLRLGFDVEAEDAGFEREIHLARRLADAGEHDLRAAGTPAASARRSSPSETTSAPAPSRPACGAPPGWNSPSSRSRPARRRRRRPC